jgi:hypothetical protein
VASLDSEYAKTQQEVVALQIEREQTREGHETEKRRLEIGMPESRPEQKDWQTKSKLKEPLFRIFALDISGINYADCFLIAM